MTFKIIIAHGAHQTAIAFVWIKAGQKSRPSQVFKHREFCRPFYRIALPQIQPDDLPLRKNGIQQKPPIVFYRNSKIFKQIILHFNGIAEQRKIQFYFLFWIFLRNQRFHPPEPRQREIRQIHRFSRRGNPQRFQGISSYSRTIIRRIFSFSRQNFLFHAVLIQHAAPHFNGIARNRNATFDKILRAVRIMHQMRISGQRL